MTYGSRLAGHAAPLEAHVDVELFGGLRQQERLSDDKLEALALEVVVQRPIVHLDFAETGTQENPRGGVLATSRAVVLDRCHASSVFLGADLDRLGLLGLVRVLGTGINLQLGADLSAEAVLREHAV